MLDEGNTTQILARFFGIYMIAAGLGITFNRERFAELMANMRESLLMTLTAGIIAFAVGAATLGIHDRWDSGLAVLVSLFGWASLLKGIFLIAFPGPYLALFEGLLVNPKVIGAMGVGSAVAGAVVLALGFG